MRDLISWNKVISRSPMTYPSLNSSENRWSLRSVRQYSIPSHRISTSRHLDPHSHANGCSTEQKPQLTLCLFHFLSRVRLHRTSPCSSSPSLILQIPKANIPTSKLRRLRIFLLQNRYWNRDCPVKPLYLLPKCIRSTRQLRPPLQLPTVLIHVYDCPALHCLIYQIWWIQR